MVGLLGVLRGDHVLGALTAECIPILLDRGWAHRCLEGRLCSHQDLADEWLWKSDQIFNNAIIIHNKVHVYLLHDGAHVFSTWKSHYSPARSCSW